MKADFPTVARPWQWGTRQSCSTVAEWGGSRDGLGWPCPRAEASSAAPPRGSLRAAGMDGQCSEMPWAASVPRGWNKASCPEGSGDPRREQRVLGKAKGRQRKARWELPFSLASSEAAPCLLLAVSNGTSRLPGLPSPCRSALAPSKDGKGRSLNVGLVQNVGRTRASLAGGRPWQCCVRGCQGRHCIPRMPLHRAGSSLQGLGVRQSQCGEAREICLKIHPPNLTCPGSKAKTSSRSRRWNHQK